MIEFEQDADASLDWEVSWPKLVPEGVSDPIVSFQAVDEDDGLDIYNQSHTDTKTTIWVRLTDQPVGSSHFVTLRATTAAGRTDDQTIRYTVIEK